MFGHYVLRKCRVWGLRAQITLRAARKQPVWGRRQSCRLLTWPAALLCLGCPQRGLVENSRARQNEPSQFFALGQSALVLLKRGAVIIHRKLSSRRRRAAVSLPPTSGSVVAARPSNGPVG